MPETNTTLPVEAQDYLESLAVDDSQLKLKAISVTAAQAELLSYCVGFITKSESWRQNSYDTKWVDFQRAADGIYDPGLAAKKKSWQSKIHVDLTASHRETIHAHLFKTMIDVNPPLEVSARFNLGDIDQSKNIRDIIARELDKTQWGVEMDKVLHDADTFGSGFIRRSYKTTIEKRKLRKESTDLYSGSVTPDDLAEYAIQGGVKSKYEESVQDVITYRGLELRHISIWDIFPDPKALKIRGTSIACRYFITYEDILKGIEAGYYLPSAEQDLKNKVQTRKYPNGEMSIQANRGIADSTTVKTEYQQEYETYELFGRMPKKWVSAIIGDTFDNGEELIPARVTFCKRGIIGVEINDDYDGEPPIEKFDYMPRNGSFYGVGVPEMLANPQAVINEVVNQRIDNGAQALNHSFAVIEKAILYPKEDLTSAPGSMIRLDATYVQDARAALQPLPINDTPLRAGFTEVNEAERWAQERTSANRVTLGTAGLVKDSNQTLGGQQLLKESAGEKFSYIGLRMEIDGLLSLFRGVWKTIYNNITPEDVEESIGAMRAQSFILVSPEELSRDYVYRPMGVYTMENKSQRQAQLIQIRQNWIGAPWVNDEAFFDASFNNIDEDPEKFKKTEDMIMQDQAAMIQPGMGEDQGMPGGIPIPPEGTAPPMPMGLQ